jgi:hypothetical protein
VQAKTQKSKPDALLAAVVDEIGALEAELAPLKPKAKRLEMLRGALRLAFDARPAAESFTCEGDRFVVQLGAKAEKRTVNGGKLFKRIGAKLFLTVANVTLKALEALGPEALDCIDSDLSGPREITVMAKGRAA